MDKTEETRTAVDWSEPCPDCGHPRRDHVGLDHLPIHCWNKQTGRCGCERTTYWTWEQGPRVTEETPGLSEAQWERWYAGKDFAFWRRAESKSENWSVPIPVEARIAAEATRPLIEALEKWVKWYDGDTYSDRDIPGIAEESRRALAAPLTGGKA